MQQMILQHTQLTNWVMEYLLFCIRRFKS